MRRWLVRVFFAVSAMITLAFVAPLAVLIRTTAEDRAIDSARADAAAVVPALVSGGTRAQVESAVGATASGTSGHMTVITGAGWVVGVPAEDSARLSEALESGASGIGDTDGGKEVVTAVSDGSGELSAIRVFVPNEDLRKGQWAAWTALALVAVMLTSISVLIADRLARTIVKPTERLADAAERLGSGDFAARVEPDGPAELVGLGETFNELGERIEEILNRERELLAELSHRLRTPLTPLRMKIDRVDDAGLAEDLRSDVDQLTGIIDDLIVEARRGTRRPRSARCDAAALVSERVEFWSVLAEDQGRRWKFSRAVKQATVSMSEEELGAALDNLLDNVFSHTVEGVPLQVKIAAKGDEVHISVEDGGEGFDRSLIAAGRSEGGSTGLGLEIARRSAMAAGGRLDVSTSELGGAAVTMMVPVVDGPPDGRSARSADR